jgi:phosphoserine aminotransferase
MSNRIFNFSAGPAVLPEEVLQQAQQDIWSLGKTGIGVLEHSHRGKAFTAVLLQAIADCRALANIPDDYEILFLTGGASSQFFMIPMNFLNKDATADYLLTGAWSKKAVSDAKRFGQVHIACSSEDKNFNYIPAEASYSKSPTYAHFTSNNTIFGTQFKTDPTPPSGVPLICDASSDIFSRPIDVSKYGLIYAGSQKNLGPAGATLVIIRKDLVEKASKDLPVMLQYRTHAADDSCYNTPPAFTIYAMGLVFKWIQKLGGLQAMADRNEAKGGKLYDYLDKGRLFKATAAKDSRSLMNVTFVTGDEKLDEQFIAFAKERGLDGLKGHRSVGGMRASIYNAFPPAGVDALIAAMQEFEDKAAKEGKAG